MNKNIKLKFYLFFLLALFGVSFYLFNYKFSYEFLNLDSLIGRKNKLIIKKYFFPYRVIKEQNKLLNEQKTQLDDQLNNLNSLKVLESLVNPYLDDLELEIKRKGSDIEVKETKSILSNNKILKKFGLTTGFFAGIYQKYPGSGYIDFHNDNLFVLSSRGVLAFNKESIDNNNFKQVRNNIDEFISSKQFKKDNRYSIKDLLIFNDKIYVSFTEEIEYNCWNTSIIYADLNYEDVKFKKLFPSDELVKEELVEAKSEEPEVIEVKEEFTYSKCIHSTGVDGEPAQPAQSGGRIIRLDENHILFSTGEYRVRNLAQNEKSVNGKILKINIQNGEYEVISMGHRNPQGLYLDKENNFLLATEHGPMGGDEINLIELENEKIQNFGWPIASYGEHYKGRIKLNEKKYEKYPLLKSHKDNGFIEPIKYFTPSIAISEITKIGKNNYVVSSLKAKSLYFFELNKKRELINFNRLEISERIRDLKYKNNNLYMFLEDTASIGLIKLK